MKTRKKIKVKSVTESKKDVLPPAVLYYPNGIPVATESSKTALYKEDHSDQYSILRTTTDDNFAFVGKTHETDIEPLSCNYAVGVFSKRTWSLKLCPILSGSLIRMEPRIKNLQYEMSKNEPVAEEVDYAQQQYSEKARTVTTFGEMKIKKRMKMAQRQMIDTNTLASKSALKAITEDITAKAKEDGLSKDQIFDRPAGEKNLPPCHLEGTTAEEAFIFYELCPSFLIDSLNPKKFKAAIHDGEVEMELRKNSESIFVLSQLELLKNETDQEKLQNKAERIAFLSALMRLKGVWKRITFSSGLDLTKMAQNFGFEFPVFSYFISTFFDQVKVKDQFRYSLNSEKENLLMCYILVVAFLVNDSILESDVLNEIVVACSITPIRLNKLLQSIGAKVSGGPRSEKQWIARLLLNGKSLIENLPKLNQTTSRRRN